jgi:hypothetical protein
MHIWSAVMKKAPYDSAGRTSCISSLDYLLMHLTHYENDFQLCRQQVNFWKMFFAYDSKVLIIFLFLSTMRAFLVESQQYLSRIVPYYQCD